VPNGHAAHHPSLQHHFDTLEQQKSSATFGMWVFLVTEVMFFGGMFLAYVLYRTWYPDAWVAASHHLDVTLGAFNTAVLMGEKVAPGATVPVPLTAPPSVPLPPSTAPAATLTAPVAADWSPFTSSVPPSTVVGPS